MSIKKKGRVVIYLNFLHFKPSWGLGKEFTWHWIWCTEGLWNDSHFVFSQKFLHRKSRVGSMDYKFGGNPTPVPIVLQNAVNLTTWNIQHIAAVTVHHQLGEVNLKIKIQSVSCLESVSYIWEVLPQSLYCNTPLNAQDIFLECGALTRTVLNGVILKLCKSRLGENTKMMIIIMNIYWVIFFMIFCTPNYTPDEGVGCWSSANLCSFVTYGVELIVFCWVFSVLGCHVKNTSCCLRALLVVRVITCELSHDLHDHSDTVSEELCRNFSYWSHLFAFCVIVLIMDVARSTHNKLDTASFQLHEYFLLHIEINAFLLHLRCTDITCRLSSRLELETLENVCVPEVYVLYTSAEHVYSVPNALND